MYSYLKNMEKMMSEDQKDMLRRIYEPCVVGTPLTDSRRDICVLPDGEIRAYGMLYETAHFKGDGQVAYLSSKDGGVSWTRHYGYGKMNSCIYVEEADLYVGVSERYSISRGLFGSGLCVLRSKIGPDDPNPEVIKLDEEACCSYLPQKSVFNNRMWITAQITDRANPNGAKEYILFYFSDDFGLTWSKRQFEFEDKFETVFPHKGLRWCQGSGVEPYAVELSENNLMMIIRTPLDSFYLSYSYDNGDTWSKPEPSTFYGTDTTAFLLRLSDGRIVTFWNNTKPLPEVNHNATQPPADNWEKTGYGEDVFTNRDAAHAAISDDGGKTFVGYREIILNPVRNNADFRYVGGVIQSVDKSVHQFQAIELPFNKILVSAGQNIASRRMIIFDVNWLYEKNRSEDFVKGLCDITTHSYVKSVSGCHYFQTGNGHCAWNRTHNAYLMPDPDGGYAEMLYICKHHDDRMVSDIGGATWNFPCTRKGRVSIELKLLEKQARFVLTDRWYNTCDTHAAGQSPFWFELDMTDTGTEFVTVDVDYDVTAGKAAVSVNGQFMFYLKMNAPCPTGLSYLILQCATDGESKGFYVKSLKSTAENS